MAGQLTKLALTRAGSSRYVKAALKELGVTREAWPKLGYRSKKLSATSGSWNFWRDQTDHELYGLFYQARAAYRSKMKKAHADNGGKHTEAIRLNAIWKFVRTQFEKHGYELQ